jgi:pilus assembly protein TadC
MQSRSIAALAALFVASPAMAEVADKEPTLGGVWAWALAFNVVALILARVRPWLALLVVPFGAFLAFTVCCELVDPYVGPAIAAELGKAYVWSGYASAALGLIGPVVIALVWNIRRRRSIP